MFAEMRESRIVTKLVIMLIAFALGALDFSLAQDVDTTDVSLPGPASNESGKGDGGDSYSWGAQVGAVAYVDSIISIRESLTPIAAGLTIGGSGGAVVVQPMDLPIDSNLSNGPVPVIEIISNALESTKLFKNGGKITVNGHFTVDTQLEDIQSKAIEFNLKKCEDTDKAVAYVCLGDFSGMTNDNPEFWSKVSAEASCEAIPNTGDLDLTGMIKEAFDASTTLSQIGILQVEYDEMANVIKKTSVIVTRTNKVKNWNGSHEVTIEVNN
jgi:hypothetical protein